MADHPKTVLITGAAGFIGSHTVAEFVRHGWYVYALIHKHGNHLLQDLQRKGRVAVIRGDVCSLESMRRVFESCRVRFDAVVHCAGYASDVGWKRRFRETNFHSVLHLVTLTQEYDVGRLVFISTTDVYGLKDFSGQAESELSYDETARNHYPKYKIKAEKWIRQMLPASRYSIVRPAAVYGEDDPTLTKRVRDFLSWSPVIPHFGKWKGRNRWPLVHVDRVARANYLMATLPQAAGEAVHVLDPQRLSVDEFYRQIAAAYFPQKRYRTVTLPFWVGVCCGAVVSGLSNLLNLRHPLIDPSLYALYSISHNLDFSCQKYLQYERLGG